MKQKKKLIIAVVMAVLVCWMIYIFSRDTTLEPPYTTGMYIVGSDIPEGEYLLETHGNGMYKMIEDKEDNHFLPTSFINRTYITLKCSEVILFEEGILYPLDIAPRFNYSGGRLKAGMYRAGRDIPPGEYYVNKDNYENDEIGDFAYLILYEGDDLQLWQKQSAQLLEGEQSFRNIDFSELKYGELKVGVDILPGEYLLFSQFGGSYRVKNAYDVTEIQKPHLIQEPIVLKEGQYFEFDNLSIIEIEG